MRKLIVILVASIMACAFAPMVGALDTDAIVVTLNPNTTLDIAVDQATWAPGCPIGGSNETTATWATLTNNGNVDIRVNVSASDTVDWTIGATADSNVFKLETLSPAVTLSNTPKVFSADIAPLGTEQFGLKVTMPTTSDTNTGQITTITFTAYALVS